MIPATRHYTLYSPVVAAAFLFAVAATSCRTTAPCLPETVIRDSIRTQRILDSIFLYERDSIFVESRRDTVWVERWRTRYKDVVRIQHDTILDTRRETQVQQVRYIPVFHKVCTWIVCLTAAALILWFLVWIAVRCRRI